jgi:hypothetical protein
MRTTKGLLFYIGEPAEAPQWFAEGRKATHAEVLHSFETGCPELRKVAESEGPSALAAYEKAVQAARVFLPPEEPCPSPEKSCAR